VVFIDNVLTYLDTVDGNFQNAFTVIDPLFEYSFRLNEYKCRSSIMKTKFIGYKVDYTELRGFEQNMN
jgi:hypothetical protein